MRTQNRFLPLLLIALPLFGCGGQSHAPGDSTVSAFASGTSAAPLPLPDSSTVSYADAGWMTYLDAEDRPDQVADWAAFGLAALLGMDAETLRDVYYDKTPVRDAFFADLAANPTGPGRSLPDARGTLHLLVPQGDRYEARTVGLLLDDYRQNTGNDPPRVRIHHFRNDSAAHTVTILAGPEEPTAQARASHGYIEQPVATLADLERFLSRSQHLSRLELKDGEVWAAGWSWPGVPAGRITAEDVAVLQRGYDDAAQGLSTEPGFSLDPGEPVTGREELVQLLTQAHYPDAEEVIDEVGATLDQFRAAAEADPSHEERIATEFAHVIEGLQQRHGDAVNLVLRASRGRPVYQFARYDGGLQGTEAGMTYFYTDLVAKAWPMEKGTGVPAGRVDGFVSDLKAKTPWGHCTVGEESGRLWFGLRENAVSLYENRVDFGQTATRLFSRVEDPEVRDREIEPSYRFGRIMWWWDRHYTAIADYEPQYHRLDQLMRWGTAIGWLVERGKRLPAIPPEQIDDRQQFGRWLAAHPALKWHYDIPFVTLTGVTSEALPILFSARYEDCGGDLSWSGGISNPSREVLSELRTSRAALSGRVARGGMSAEYTNFSEAARTGTIGNRELRRTLEAVEGNATRVETAAQGRKVWSLSRLKAAVSETAERRLGLSLSSSGGRLAQRLEVQGLEVGELSATVRGHSVTVRWQPSILDRTRRALASLQDALGVPGRSLEDAAGRVGNASLEYVEPGTGRVLLRMDAGRDSRWVDVERGAASPGDEMTFRLGAPNPGGREPRWFSAHFADPPALRGPAGSPAEWLEARSRSGSTVHVGAADPPGPSSRSYTVHDPDGRRGIIYLDRGRAKASVTDPVFGLHGTHEGAALMDAVPLRRLEQALSPGHPQGYARAVDLTDDAVAIVDGDGITLVPASHPWHQRVRAALAAGGDGGTWVRVENGRLVLAQPLAPVRTGPPGNATDLADVLAYLRGGEGSSRASRAPPVFLDRDLARAVLEEGRIPADPVGAGWQVQIVELNAAQAHALAAAAPDRALWSGKEWVPARALASSARAAGGAGPGAGPGGGVTYRMVYRATNGCDDGRARTADGRCEG